MDGPHGLYMIQLLRPPTAPPRLPFEVNERLRTPEFTEQEDTNTCFLFVSDQWTDDARREVYINALCDFVTTADLDAAKQWLLDLVNARYS